MWQQAVNRQYNLFGILLSFFTAAFTVVGSILGASVSGTLPCWVLIMFSVASLLVFVAVVILLRMVHVERKIAFRAETPKPGDTELQREENKLRLAINTLLGTITFLLLLFVNLVLWVR